MTEQRHTIRIEYGLDCGLAMQYAADVGHRLTLDLGSQPLVARPQSDRPSGTYKTLGYSWL